MNYLFDRAFVYDELKENEKGISDLLRIIELDKDGSIINVSGKAVNIYFAF